jgi:cytochrome c-type biogenesis protein CcmH/NrfF
MMMGYGDWSGSGWVLWCVGGIILVALVILAVWAVSRRQRPGV